MQPMKNNLESIVSLNYQPSQLTERELDYPAEVIASFFAENELHQIRANIWELYKGWVSSCIHFAEGKQYADMLFFYSQLIDFLDASYLQMQLNADELA
jgi:hypothetical protein